MTVSVFYSVSCRGQLSCYLCSCGAFKLYMHKVSKQCRIAKTLGDQVKMSCGDFFKVQRLSSPTDPRGHCRYNIGGIHASTHIRTQYNIHKIHSVV